MCLFRVRASFDRGVGGGVHAKVVSGVMSFYLRVFATAAGRSRQVMGPHGNGGVSTTCVVCFFLFFLFFHLSVCLPGWLAVGLFGLLLGWIILRDRWRHDPKDIGKQELEPEAVMGTRCCDDWLRTPYSNPAAVVGIAHKERKDSEPHP